MQEGINRVSTINPSSSTLESKYLTMGVLPVENFELALVCSNLLASYALYDVYRSDNMRAKCEDLLNEALSKCTNEQSFRVLDNFLNKASTIGDVGMTFYNKIKPMIDIKINPPKEEPIKNEKNGKSWSEHYDIDYRPTDFDINGSCSSMLVYFEYGENAPTPKNKAYWEGVCVRQLKDILELCKTPNDIMEVKHFMEETTKYGGTFAVMFMEKYSKYINKGSIRELEKMIPENVKNNPWNSKVKEFEDRLKAVNSLKKQILSGSTIDTDDLEELISKYTVLKNELADLENHMDNDKYLDYYADIIEYIEHLEGIIETLKETERMFDNL